MTVQCKGRTIAGERCTRMTNSEDGYCCEAHRLSGEERAAADADADDALTGEFTWVIEGFSKWMIEGAKLHSPVFQSGQYNWCAAPARASRQRQQPSAACPARVLDAGWPAAPPDLRRRKPSVGGPQPRRRRILLFPGGNNVQQLSVYLDVADSATLPQGWTRHACFTLTVHNQKKPARNVIKGAPAPLVPRRSCGAQRRVGTAPAVTPSPPLRAAQTPTTSSTCAPAIGAFGSS